MVATSLLGICPSNFMSEYHQWTKTLKKSKHIPVFMCEIFKEEIKINTVYGTPIQKKAESLESLPSIQKFLVESVSGLGALSFFSSFLSLLFSFSSPPLPPLFLSSLSQPPSLSLSPSSPPSLLLSLLSLLYN